MEKIELVKGMGYLGVAIGKEYTPEECEVFYDFLKKYDYKVFVEAIKNRIKKSQFPPKINELIDECNFCKEQIDFALIDFMKLKGYFKEVSEYEKAMTFLKKGIIPNWFQNDMEKYQALINQKEIEWGG